MNSLRAYQVQQENFLELRDRVIRIYLQILEFYINKHLVFFHPRPPEVEEEPEVALLKVLLPLDSSVVHLLRWKVPQKIVSSLFLTKPSQDEEDQTMQHLIQVKSIDLPLESHPLFE